MLIFETKVGYKSSKLGPTLQNRSILQEQLLADSHRVIRALDSMSDSSRIIEDLPVISAFESLIAEEVNLLEVLVLDVLQAVCLVPSSWEDIKRDLTTNGIGEAQVWENIAERLYEYLTCLVGLVESFVGIAFFGAVYDENTRQRVIEQKLRDAA